MFADSNSDFEMPFRECLHESQKATFSCIMSAFPTVSTRLPQDTFASDYVLEIFMKNCAENLNVVKCVKNYRALYMKV